MKVALVCSHGGHYSELMRLLPAFRDYEFFFVTYKSARADEVKALGGAYFMTNLGLNPLRMTFAFVRFLYILIKEKPQVILTTGAEIGLPAMYVGRLLGIYTIYIESWCRTRSASLTGKLVYPIVHEFLVQWPSMLEVYGPKAKFHGGVV